jgi:hypothetical protein
MVVRIELEQQEKFHNVFRTRKATGSPACPPPFSWVAEKGLKW